MSSRISPRTSTVIFLRQVAVGDGGRDLRDVSHLPVRFDGHEVHVVGKVLPGSGDTRHRRLPAELALRSDFARDAGHLGGERVELIDHRVDRVLELQNLAFHVDGDLARQIAARDRRRHFGDVSDLAGEVAGHRVHVVRQVLPRSGDPRNLRLAAELPLGADLARDARHLAGEAIELVDHRVDRFLQLKDLAAHVDRDLARRSPLAIAVATSAMLRT